MNAQIDISNTILQSKRLLLRPWEPGDVDDLFEYASVDGVGQAAGWPPHKSKEISQKVLDSFIAHKNDFAIVYKENNKVIGSFGIGCYKESVFDDSFRNKLGRELGYVLSKSYWGQGLMPEAVECVTKYLFDELGLDFAVISCYLGNERSMRVAEKCGFEFYGESRNISQTTGEIRHLKNYVRNAR